MLREELQLLQEQGSYVGEVVKAMDKKKVLVKVGIYFQIIELSLTATQQLWLYLAAQDRGEGYIGNPLSSNFYGSLMFQG